MAIERAQREVEDSVQEVQKTVAVQQKAAEVAEEGGKPTGMNLMNDMWKRSREERVHALINESVEVLREREAILLDDTTLQLSDWLRLLKKLSKCRGDTDALKLKRLSLHNCQLQPKIAEEFGLMLAYSCPQLESLSLHGNDSLGYQVQRTRVSNTVRVVLCVSTISSIYRYCVRK